MSEDALPQESIGQRLRRLRIERGLSQQQLTGSGLSTAHISRIESGKRQPSVRAIRLLAQEFPVSPEYLETGYTVTASESLELRLADAEVRIRFGEDSSAVLAALEDIYLETQRAGNTVLLVRALIDLGLVTASQGRYGEAASRLERAIEVGALHPATHSNVFGTLGRTYWMLDEYERYKELMESCLERLAEYPAEETGVARTKYMTQLSYALSCLGEFDRARDLLLEVGDREEQRMDLYDRARLYWSLACLSTAEGKLSAALDYIRRSIAFLETSEDDVHLGRAHLLCALIFNLDDRAVEANRHLALAEELFGPRIDPIDLGQLRTEQAKSRAQLGDSEGAVALAEEAIRLLEGDPDYLGSAWHALAKAHAARGHVDEACLYYEKAVERMDGNRSEWREAAQACRGWALALKQAGQREAAALAFGRAAEIMRRAASGAPIPKPR